MFSIENWYPYICTFQVLINDREKVQSFIFTKIFKVQSLKQIQCVNINLLEYFETRYQILTITGKMTDVLHHRLHCCIYSFFFKHQFLLISGMQPVKHTFLRLTLLDTWQKQKILTYYLWEMLATCSYEPASICSTDDWGFHKWWHVDVMF